jgi:hypothetical protein
MDPLVRVVTRLTLKLVGRLPASPRSCSRKPYATQLCELHHGTIYRGTRLKELVMKILGRPSLVILAGLLGAAPAFAQTTQSQNQTSQAQKPASEVKKQRTQDGNSPTTVGPGSKAYKQQTQGDLPEVGPASKAYNGNSLRSKY